MRRNERGNAAIEVVILAPAFILIAAWIVAYARVALAEDAVAGSAGAAARAASLERNAGSARDAAKQIADGNLTSRGLRCTSTSLQVDTSQFALPVGQKAEVTVTLACTVPFGDLGLPISGSRTITKTSSVPLDTYRERNP